MGFSKARYKTHEEFKDICVGYPVGSNTPNIRPCSEIRKLCIQEMSVFSPFNVLDVGGRNGENHSELLNENLTSNINKYYVLETDAFVSSYRTISNPNIKLISSLNDCDNKDKIDLIYTNGGFQYMKCPLTDFVDRFNPKMFLFERTSVSNEESFYTVQDFGGNLAYRVYGKEELETSLKDYDLIKEDDFDMRFEKGYGFIPKSMLWKRK